MHINIAKINFKPIGINIAKVDFSLYDVANYQDEYLTLSALEDGNITITIPAGINSLYATSLSYSKDKSTWNETLIDDTEQTITIPVTSGEIVYLKGIAKQLGNSSIGVHINSTTNIDASGNIMSLLYGDDFKDKTTFPEESQYTFGELFYNNRHLVNAKNLILPATTLAICCYRFMFQNCTSLTTTPELPATTLANICYGNMFSGCYSLTKAPELPATTLADSCYRSMFYGCTSLTTAPELPATTLATSCYFGMFQNCKSLTTTPELAATTLANNCYTGMFQNCTSLTTTPELPATTLANACYNFMFYGCNSLTTAPELPATTLATSCYFGMFQNCTLLSQAPALPATTLTESCYNSMFYGCTSLTTAPALPATTLTESCYNSMFYGCKKLSKITMLATNISANNCLTNWVYDVATSGTFTKAASMTSLPTGSSGIPAGWTVQVEGGVTPEPERDYLCFTSTGDSTVAMTQNGTPNKSANKVILYKLNNGQWQTWDLSAVTLTDGDKMYLKSDDEIPMSEAENIYKKFTMTGSIAASGNVMSLFNFSDTLPSYAFNSLFENCTSLTTAPALPATTLAELCYFAMFYNCTSLTTAPELHATTLEKMCYRSMFYNCTSLTTAPELPATTLAERCYYIMFYGCKKLSKITMLAADISAHDCLLNWVNGVASTGTFTKASSMTSLPTGSSGIPAGWTVVDYGAA